MTRTTMLTGDMAALVGVRDETIRIWIRTGEIPPSAYRRVRGRIYLVRWHVESWLETGEWPVASATAGTALSAAALGAGPMQAEPATPWRSPVALPT